MATILITGGAGFFGSILTKRLLDDGHRCVVLDLHKTDMQHDMLTAVQGDIRDRNTLSQLFSSYRFETVHHCAAILAHAAKDRKFLWESNVDGTRNIAECAVEHGTRSLVFISSNCLWAANMGRLVREDDKPDPIEIYGRSKWEAERILSEFAGRMNVVTIRSPTIIDEGRLGLLAILFEFIDEGRRVWVVGGGHNRYQFIYAPDLADACVRAAAAGVSRVLNIGSDDVTSFRESFQYVIDRAGTGARICDLPRRPALAAMWVAHALRISPLGPYQVRMIAEDFAFDTQAIKQTLQWTPTLSNSEMLWRAYRYYHLNRNEIARREGVSAHRQAADMGIIRALKWIS